MKKQKFTGGEWKICQNYLDKVNGSGHIQIGTEEETWIAETKGTHVGPKSKGIAVANAKLIIAAPNMYKDLKSLVLSITAHPDYVNGSKNDEWHTLVNLAKKTLKKAVS